MSKLILVIFIWYSIRLRVRAYDETYTEKLRYLSCGRTDVIQGDIRTSSPWSAVIFYKGDDNSKPRFFTTGVIVGPTTILTVAPGPLGGPLRGSSERDKLHPASKFLVGVGLNSTNYDSQDDHSQLVRVHFLEPYVYHDPENEHYHLLLYHLRTILDLRTPYVRSLCLIPRSYYNDQVPILQLSEHRAVFPFTWSGYTTTLSRYPSYNYDLAETTAITLSADTCKKLFKFHYKRESFEKFNLYCARKVLGKDKLFEGPSSGGENVTDEFPFHKAREDEDKQVCYVHGSVATFNFNQRAFLAGLTVLIPGRRRDRCNDRAVYMVVEMGFYYEWLARAVECSPSKYSCGETSETCVKIANVCNGIKDCDNGHDENLDMCYAQNPCNEQTNDGSASNGSNDTRYFCGVTDNCIAATKLCDNSVDCDDGGDEAEERCENVLSGVSQYSEDLKCPLPSEPLGGRVRCLSEMNQEIPCGDSVSVNSSIEFVCQNLHVSYYDYSVVRMKCNENGEFSRRKPFSCVPECGTYESNSGDGILKYFNSSTSLNQNMPWNMLIFTRVNASRNGSETVVAKAICSAVLIDPSFAITSANCLKRVKIARILLVFEPVTTFLEAGIPVVADAMRKQSGFAVALEQHWVSKSDSPYTDLALMKIAPRAETNDFGQAQGGMPCFLSNPKAFAKAPSLNSTGWMTLFKPSLSSPAAIQIGEQTVSQLYGYEARIASFSECAENIPLENLPNYAFCITFEADQLAGYNQRINVGAGFYTRQRQRTETERFRYHLKGISFTKARASQRPNNSSNVVYYQWYSGIEPFTDWITDVLEQNY